MNTTTSLVTHMIRGQLRQTMGIRLQMKIISHKQSYQSELVFHSWDNQMVHLYVKQALMILSNKKMKVSQLNHLVHRTQHAGVQRTLLPCLTLFMT